MNDAEQLLNSLTGVLSARMVADPEGEIEEIHLLTTQDVSPKQTVRNVESALLAQLGINVDHRKISVARTSARPGEEAPDLSVGLNGRGPAGSDRLLFLNSSIENEGPHRIRARVTIEWDGQEYTGQAVGADLPRNRLEILARAVLQTLEAVLGAPEDPDEHTTAALALDGVRLVRAFERRYVLVGVQAIHGREVQVLAGSAPVEEVPERAVVLAALQATDRWVRGLL